MKREISQNFIPHEGIISIQQINQQGALSRHKIALLHVLNILEFTFRGEKVALQRYLKNDFYFKFFLENKILTINF